MSFYMCHLIDSAHKNIGEHLKKFTHVKRMKLRILIIIFIVDSDIIKAKGNKNQAKFP